ncbi:hypothetical protein DBB_44420 [Desulfoluna spongiiphila]|nr:hypothetical protein DBB_44420 [Desulfoluna spongiiphila]
MAVRPSRLADQIEEVMDNYHQLDGVRQDARRTGVHDFSMERHCRALVGVYEELLKPERI